MTALPVLPVTKAVNREHFATIARASQELELMVRRAARVGELDIADIIDAYVLLEPSGHLHLQNPRKVSVETLTDTLRRLPVMFTEVAEVRLVPNLDGFECRAIPGAGWRAGLSNDGVLLIELTDGLHSLMGFASTICALAIEWSKINTLVQSDVEPPTDFEPESADDAMAAAGIEVPEAEGEDAAPAEETVEADPSLRDLADLAFDLGVTEEQLVDASAQTRGVLFELFGRPVTLPIIRIHADLAVEELDRRGARIGRQIGEILAEAGLATRPVHLWLGGEVITDCLSPYGRELRDPLVSWAREHSESLGLDLHADLDALGAEPVHHGPEAHDVTQEHRSLEIDPFDRGGDPAVQSVPTRFDESGLIDPA
ncbi:MAG: hypothetical protein AAF658_08760, partial [Myxococcota bacterium]